VIHGDQPAEPGVSKVVSWLLALVLLTVYRALRRGRGGVVDHVTVVVGPVETESRPESKDARILKEAVRESILTSPGSFLKTVADVDTTSVGYWDKEIKTSTWVVIQQLDEVVGIAVARWPNKEIDRDIDQVKARFIESVWIAPRFRRSRMGERLVNYLIDVESEQFPSVSQFMLWVFEDNKHAIRLYKRMRFNRVDEHALENGRIELRYEYALPEPSARRAARKANEAARERDLLQHGVTYRVLRSDIA
jgi:ribosomal protein S18 acetylase RimI-like enzyme